MYAITENIAFTFNIEPMAANIPTTVSLLLVDAEGNSTFDVDGVGVSAVYTAPTGITAGTYTFTTSFPTAGIWEIVLAEGVAASYQVHTRDTNNI